MANKKISDLTAGSALTGTELIEIEQSSTSKYTTPADLKTYMQSNLSLITSGTAQATTSGTSIDFTSIPATVKRITVMFSSVSTNGGSYPLVQIGDAGGVEATGYAGAASRAASFNALSSGFTIDNAATAGEVISGAMVLTLLDSTTNTWACQSVMGISVGSGVGMASLTGGVKSLSAALDRVRITTVNGTDAFDSGKINILYE